MICDWQGVNAGGASGDISFFLSRLGADGIVLELQHMSAANTILQEIL